MGRLPKQTKRKEMIKRFKELRFTGPHSGTGPHPQYMEREGLVVKMPNPHKGDIGEGLLKRILAEASISVEEWLGEELPSKGLGETLESPSPKEEARKPQHR